MRPKRRTVLGCGVLGVLVLAAIGASLRFPMSASPLTGATAVVSTADWDSDMRMESGFPNYYWSDGNTLTYFGRGADGTTHLFQKPQGATPREGAQVELRSGSYAGQLSPDGKWFVEWNQNRLRQRVPTFVSTDGLQRKAGKPTWGREGVWSSGSSHRMYCSVWRSGTAADVYNPDADTAENVLFAGTSHLYWPQRVDAQGRLIGFQDGSYVMRMPATQIASLNTPALKMAWVDTIHLEKPGEVWQTPVPFDEGTGNCLLSPAADRILWIVRGDLRTKFVKRISSYLPARFAAPRNGVRWIVTDLHGGHVKVVAEYTLPARQSRHIQRDSFSNPRWTSDSKHLSFIYENTLYLRPVD